MAKGKTSDSYGSARWANPQDLKDEGILHFPAYHQNRQLLSNKHYRQQFLKDDPVARSFLLGRLGDPAVLTGGIREGYEQATSGMFDGLVSLLVGNGGGEEATHIKRDSILDGQEMVIC